VNVIAHKVCDDELQYRVQWSNHEFEWTSGPSLDLPDTSSYLLRYWKTGGREVTDKSTQTDPGRIFEFPETPEDLEQATQSFVQFPATAKSVSGDASVRSSRIPVAIQEIDIHKKIAIVKFGSQTEPSEMELQSLRILAPRLVADYYLTKFLPQ
jgi:hypothetical protein